MRLTQQSEITDTDREFMAQVVALCESSTQQAHAEYLNRLKVIGNEIETENRQTEAKLAQHVKAALLAVALPVWATGALVSAVVAFAVTRCAG